MLQFSLFKKLFIYLVCVTGFLFALPNVLTPEQREGWPDALPHKAMNLGLDLRGGVDLLLQIQFDEYLGEQLEQVVADVREKLRKGKDRKQIKFVGLGVNAKTVTFRLRNLGDVAEVEKRLSDYRREFSVDISDSGQVVMEHRSPEVEKMLKKVVSQSIEIVRRRVDETGTLEPIIVREGDDRIRLQIPGIADSSDVKRKLLKTAKMSFHMMDKKNPFPVRKKRPLVGYELLGGKDGDTQFYMVEKRAMLTGDMLVDASVQFDQGRPVVAFRFNAVGGKKFAKVTRENISKPFAIVLDGQVISAPVIQSPIVGGSGIITGRFTTVEANDLALLLRAGALPASLKFIEERTVGPSLGQDSIDAGKAAATIAVVLVVVMMILFYGLFGFFSVIALSVNMILIVALLSFFQATLTLPGIAGMVLTLGIAVDANVLIFERIREEIRIGKSPYAAIDNGFSSAFKTILDSNITTLIATLLLFIFGSGPVKGFAVTLSVGIICSMFSAILLTRLMVVTWLHKKKPKELNL